MDEMRTFRADGFLPEEAQQQEVSVGVLDTSMENILYLAEKAEKMIDAMNKIMNAALRITSEHDWCLIAGKPYLQESGATKVARLFGISWSIQDPVTECDAEGYKTYIFKGKFYMRGQSVEAEGTRSMKDDFFCGRGDRRKKPDEILERNVRLAAYTNCINNGIKRIIPNLRNVDVKVLESAGLDVSKMSGYTFRDGSQGGKGKGSTGLLCEKCGTEVDQKVASYSQSYYGGHIYCRDCQKEAKK
ncbi:MAG: hypothetical protein Q4D90_11390 [bacterium]|nr:hypothetical protein [bacterium]